MSISATRSMPQAVESRLLFKVRPEIHDAKSVSALNDNDIVTAGPVKTLNSKVKKIEDNIPETPTENGVYVYTCTVSDGVVTYSWEEQE